MPMVQVEVEKLKKSLKFMISSRCYSYNLNFSWAGVHLEITYWYNQMIHINTIFTLSTLLYETTYDNTVDKFCTA